MKPIKTTILTILTLFIISCSTTQMYDGPKRSRDQIAVINGMSPLDPLTLGISAQVKKVDGKPVPGSGTKIEVLPGEHEFEVYCSMSGRSFTGTMTLNIEAGGDYIIPVGVEGNKCSFDIRNRNAFR